MGCAPSTQQEPHQVVGPTPNYTSAMGRNYSTTAGDNNNASIPDRFYCPISHEIMKRPVIASDGISYDESSLYEWVVTRNNKTSPTTRQPLQQHEWYPNRMLRNEIEEYFQNGNNKVKDNIIDKSGSNLSCSSEDHTIKKDKTKRIFFKKNHHDNNNTKATNYQTLEETMNDDHDDTDFAYVGEGTLVTSSVGTASPRYYGVVQYRRFANSEQSLLRVMKMVCLAEDESVGFHYNNDPTNTSQYLQCAILYDVEKLVKSGRFDTIHKFVPIIMKILRNSNNSHDGVVWSCLDKPPSKHGNNGMIWNGTGIPNPSVASNEVNMGWDTWYCYRKTNL
eukprot:CAMPEP_0195281880 /NCGR_PEP_ID=MMETSP0707-20130614/1003_1 /TAXON_ID=33640 /ORGANISM="Asterionellopsis glacialis, Strain CCMP134" /LENGTH=334 /DNA_ID=CAMNT_0040340807 /DNA_START=23 /DNA_END=1027 /DNA_ORIENTATION=+